MHMDAQHQFDNTLDPNNLEAQYDELVRLIEEGEKWQAIYDTSDARMRNRYDLAYECFREGDLKQAKIIFAHLSAIDPLNPKYWNALAGCHIKMEDYNGAVKALNMTSLIEPDDPKAYLHLGFCYIKLGREMEAFDALGVTLQLAQDEPLYRPLAEKAIAWLGRLGEEQ